MTLDIAHPIFSDVGCAVGQKTVLGDVSILSLCHPFEPSECFFVSTCFQRQNYSLVLGELNVLERFKNAPLINGLDRLHDSSPLSTSYTMSFSLGYRSFRRRR